MDLTKPLPDRIYVRGNGYLIKTDFREWIKFSRVLANSDGNPAFGDITFLFKDEDIQILKEDLPFLLIELIKFYSNPNPVPKETGGGSGIKTYDFDIDAEYIYAAFMQEYHINLFKNHLHWHEFIALFKSLSEDVFISKIMGYRSYKKDNRTQEQVLQNLKYTWALPIEYTEEEEQAINEFNNYFS